MKTLTTDMDQIIEALQNSNLLQLSPDKRKVKRVTPTTEHEPTSDTNRTVYIVIIKQSNFPNFKENFSLNSSHEEIEAMFNQIGKVTYVSLPRYPDKSLKGKNST
jgi:serine protease inhibitor